MRAPHGADRGLTRRPVRLPTLVLLAVAALALGACGGDDELVSETPRTTPDLTIPTTADDSGGDAADAADEPGTSTTATTGDDAAGAAGDPGATGGTAAGATGGAAAAPADPAAPAGGTAAPQPGADGQSAPQGQPEPESTGGAEAGGASADFCANNPGAC